MVSHVTPGIYALSSWVMPASRRAGAWPLTPHRSHTMDTELLTVYEQQLADTNRTAYDADATLDDPPRRIRWSVLHRDDRSPGALYEVSGQVSDLGGELRHRVDAYRASGRT